MDVLISGARIWDGKSCYIDNGAILIHDGEVANVLSREELSDIRLPDQLRRVDAKGKLAIPGLINAHTHLYSSLARGMSVSGFSPTSLTEILEQLWWRLDKALDKESIQASALVGAMEAARCGITTLVDHHASPSTIEGSLEALKSVVCDRLGLRAAFCYEVTDRNGEAGRNQGIAENVTFIDKHSADTQSAALFGLHASFTVSDSTLTDVAEHLPEGTGIHIHVAEGPEDEADARDTHGVSVVERLDRFDLLGPTSVLAHCIHTSGGEREIIAERDAVVVHNPRSNMNNAVGAFDMTDFLSRDIVTGLGTDGLGANMLGEVFTASLLQKHVSEDPLAGTFSDLQRMLFENNAELVRRLFGVNVGQIARGHCADIVLLDYAPPTPLTADNVLGHLLFGMAVHRLPVSDLFVGGVQILKDGDFPDVDEEQIYAHAREQAKKIWSKVG